MGRVRGTGAASRGAVCILLPGILWLVAGCAGLFSTGPTEEEKRAFLAELDAQNLSQREKCFRIYRYDKSWAREYSPCWRLADSLDALYDVDSDDVTVDKPKVGDDIKVIPVDPP